MRVWVYRSLLCLCEISLNSIVVNDHLHLLQTSKEIWGRKTADILLPGQMAIFCFFCDTFWWLISVCLPNARFFIGRCKGSQTEEESSHLSSSKVRGSFFLRRLVWFFFAFCVKLLKHFKICFFNCDFCNAVAIGLGHISLQAYVYAFVFAVYYLFYALHNN